MTDPTGFVPAGPDTALITADKGAPPAVDATGFVPAATSFAFVVPDGPSGRPDDAGWSPPRFPRLPWR
ncbi:MAG: hypothetical protein JHC84_02030 [Solirubrobacteraceae bacterium]|nr:hypothetical protein [Solirubrobacteraceae bacterium]